MFKDSDDQAPKLISFDWLPGYQINVTVQSPTKDHTMSGCVYAPAAIGHFTMPVIFIDLNTKE